MANSPLIQHFQKARDWIEESEHAHRVSVLRSLYPDQVDAGFFFRHYAPVVLAAGYSWRNLETLSPRLNKAFIEYDYQAIAKNPVSVFQSALEVFNHKGKVGAIVSMAERLASDDWAGLKAKLTGPNHLEEIDALPWIGAITKYHLARNIGLDYEKPDRRMCEIAGEFGYTDDTPGVFSMVRAIQEYSGERPGVIDLILWRYEEMRV